METGRKQDYNNRGWLGMGCVILYSRLVEVNTTVIGWSHYADVAIFNDEEEGEEERRATVEMNPFMHRPTYIPHLVGYSTIE